MISMKKDAAVRKAVEILFKYFDNDPIFGSIHFTMYQQGRLYRGIYQHACHDNTRVEVRETKPHYFDVLLELPEFKENVDMLDGMLGASLLIDPVTKIGHYKVRDVKTNKILYYEEFCGVTPKDLKLSFNKIVELYML